MRSKKQRCGPCALRSSRLTTAKPLKTEGHLSRDPRRQRAAASTGLKKARKLPSFSKRLILLHAQGPTFMPTWYPDAKVICNGRKCDDPGSTPERAPCRRSGVATTLLYPAPRRSSTPKGRVDRFNAQVTAIGKASTVPPARLRQTAVRPPTTSRPDQGPQCPAAKGLPASVAESPLASGFLLSAEPGPDGCLVLRRAAWKVACRTFATWSDNWPIRRASNPQLESLRRRALRLNPWCWPMAHFSSFQRQARRDAQLLRENRGDP